MREHVFALRQILSPLLVLLLAALAVGACGSGRPIRYYTLDLPPAPPPSASPYPVTLLIGRIGGPGILQDEAIAYRNGPNEIGTYGLHHWAEPPVQMLKVVLLRQLRASGRYQSVAELGSSAQGELVLEGRLDDFEEVDNGGAAAALVTMEFDLLDRKAARIVWTHVYSRSEPVQGKEIPDVVAALNRNLLQGLTEVSSGLEMYCSTRTPGKPSTEGVQASSK